MAARGVRLCSLLLLAALAGLGAEAKVSGAGGTGQLVLPVLGPASVRRPRRALGSRRSFRLPGPTAAPAGCRGRPQPVVSCGRCPAPLGGGAGPGGAASAPPGFLRSP